MVSLEQAKTALDTLKEFLGLSAMNLIVGEVSVCDPAGLDKYILSMRDSKDNGMYVTIGHNNKINFVNATTSAKNRCSWNFSEEKC
jgi:hypothetical protein